MNDRFFELNKEKQDRMINAACQVLSLNGYANASTDAIVKAASISKGLLFHYFGSKQGMYEFMCDFCSKYAVLELKSSIRNPSSDFFGLHRQIIEAFVTILRHYPYLLLFIETASLDKDPAVSEFMDDQYEVCLRELKTKALPPDKLTRQEAELMSQMIIGNAMHEMRTGLTDGSFDPDEFRRHMLSCIDMLKKHAQ